jgi:hypothetical protein
MYVEEERVPEIDAEPHEQKLKELTSSQYQSIGMFVEAFEQVVLVLRFGTQRMMSLDTDEQRLLAMVVLNNSSLTAKPLLDIFVAVVAEKLKDKEKYAGHEILKQILSNINKRFSSMQSKRNNLLHGTWSVFSNYDPNAETHPLQVAKWTNSGDGLKLIDMPKTVAELDEITDECRAIYDVLLNFITQFPDVASFKCQNGKWSV